MHDVQVARRRRGFEDRHLMGRPAVHPLAASLAGERDGRVALDRFPELTRSECRVLALTDGAVRP